MLQHPRVVLVLALLAFASAASAADDKPANPFGITAPELKEAKTIVKLPEAASDVVLGGGGRYLIFNMPKVKKLAIFDVNEAKVTKEILLSEDDVAYAA